MVSCQFTPLESMIKVSVYWSLYAQEKTLGQTVILLWPSCTLMHLITPPRTELSRSPKNLPRATPGEMKTKTCSSLHRWVNAWCSKAGSQWKASASRAGMAAPCWWGICAECRITSTDHHHTTSIMEWQIKAVKHTKFTWGASPSRLLCSPLFLLHNTQYPTGNGQREIFSPVQARYVLGFYCFIAQ